MSSKLDAGYGCFMNILSLEKLKSYNVKVIMTRTNDNNLTLSERAKLNFNMKYFSFHTSSQENYL